MQIIIFDDYIYPNRRNVFCASGTFTTLLDGKYTIFDL
jgi:hypothetical protein